MANIERLRDFVAQVTRTIEKHEEDEAVTLASLHPVLHELLQADDFLPAAYAQPHPHHYQQYLLYGDPLDRFSIVSFVWGAGQKTPIHNHRVWGLVGVWRGLELSTAYRMQNNRLVPAPTQRLEPGKIEAVSPRIGDIHQIANGYDDRASISIHIYGGNIGRIQREVFSPETGEAKSFTSSYAPFPTPNLWV